MKLSNLRCSTKIFSNNALSKACNGRCTAVGEPDNAMKRRKALLSEEELFVRAKVPKASKRASETRAHLGKNRTEHI